MSAPFQSISIKVYPFTNEVIIAGVSFKSADELWAHLFKSALAHAPNKNGPQIGDMALTAHDTPPEVREYLAKHGRFKLPVSKHPEAKPVKVMALSDF